MKKIVFLCLVFSIAGYHSIHPSTLIRNYIGHSGQTDGRIAQQKEFNIDELIENADVPDQLPISRELPWYIDVIQKPATRTLLFVCSVLDWLRTKTGHMTRWANHFGKKTHECTI